MRVIMRPGASPDGVYVVGAGEWEVKKVKYKFSPLSPPPGRVVRLFRDLLHPPLIPPSPTIFDTDIDIKNGRDYQNSRPDP
jgi:hypothetical protein